jgi:HEAT repeat protein
MKTRILLSTLVLAGVAWLGSPSTAFAREGVVLNPSALRAPDRSSLADQIAKARANNPTVFANVAKLRTDLPQLDAHKRGRFVPVARLLRGLGRDALLPMLEELAVDAPARGSMTNSAWTAWRVGLVESVGSLRDPRSAPVLIAILESPHTDFMLIRAAAAAYGKLGTDQVAQDLIRLSRTKGPKQRAILAGMGHCRRIVVASELARVLSTRPDPDTAVRVARSLGDLGSAWAWETSSLAGNKEGPAVRSVAAQALMDAFVSYDGEVRAMATKALLVVNDPSTPGLISAARSQASADLLPALDRLQRHYANNPIR